MPTIRHLLTLFDLSTDELLHLVDYGIELKARHARGDDPPALAGKVVGLVFEKASTRTRVSFESGVYHLGGNAVVITSQGSQIARGEPAEDTARVMGRYCDLLMVRTFGQQIIEDYARYSGVPVINGLTDKAHPCQLLADLMTCKEKGLDIRSMHVGWIGDGNNMAHSWIAAAGLLGFSLRLAVPRGHEPDEAIIARARELSDASIEVGHQAARAAEGADIVTTDVWASMGQEDEAVARQRVFEGFSISLAIMGKAREGALVLHCLPAHRGEEISAEVLEAHPEIFDQAENRLHAQKALMAWLMERAG